MAISLVVGDLKITRFLHSGQITVHTSANWPNRGTFGRCQATRRVFNETGLRLPVPTRQRSPGNVVNGGVPAIH